MISSTVTVQHLQQHAQLVSYPLLSVTSADTRKSNPSWMDSLDWLALFLQTGAYSYILNIVRSIIERTKRRGFCFDKRFQKTLWKL